MTAPKENLYLSRTDAGAWQYRRRVPGDLLEVLGRHEWKLTLSKVEDQETAEVIARHLTDRIDAHIAETRRRQRATSEHPMPAGKEWLLYEAVYRLEKMMARSDDD